MKKNLLKIFSLALILAAIDQISKFLVLKFLTFPLFIIGSFFQFQYAENIGIAFSIEIPFGLLIIVNFILLALIAFFSIRELNLNKKLARVPIALVIGGGLGNLIDRFSHGFVIDFIDFNFWPAFNLADIYVTVGVIMILVFYKQTKKDSA